LDIDFVEQGHEILELVGGVDTIAKAARTCYRSEGKASPENDERLVRSLIRNGHHAMLEFGWMMVKFTTDRAIANELVRHRHLSFAQESTRYVNSSKRGFAFVLPSGIGVDARQGMEDRCYKDAQYYSVLIRYGTVPEVARSVLPLCTAAEIVAAGNLREWRHVLALRTAPDAHPQMRSLMLPLLEELRERVPVVFEDVG